MLRLKHFALILLTILSISSCTDPGYSTDLRYTKADLDQQYRIGFERGNRQGHERGFDLARGGGQYGYIAPSYRQGSGFRVYISPRSGGHGYNDNYGYQNRSNNGRNSQYDNDRDRRDNNSGSYNRSSDETGSKQTRKQREAKIRRDAKKEVKDRVTRDDSRVNSKGRTVYDNAGSKPAKVYKRTPKPKAKPVVRTPKRDKPKVKTYKRSKKR